MKELAKLLTDISDKTLMQRFLNELLTDAEQERLENRIKLVRMLQSGHTQREIAKKLHISLCNITRGARELKKKNSAFNTILKNNTTGQQNG